MPYKSAFCVSETPGGKCTPLMNRTVLLVKGAWLLLKNAPVRASPTATSLLLTCWPKFPVTVGGASGLHYSATTFPARSTTAITAVAGEVAAAAARTMMSTSLAVNVAADGVTTGGGTVLVLPPPQPASKNVSNPASPAATAIPTASIFRRLLCARRASTGFLNLCSGMAGVLKYRIFSGALNIVAEAMPPIDDRLNPATWPVGWRSSRPSVALLNVSMASEIYCPWLVLIVI